ncbi:MAG: ribose 5-phosphate isomerase B [Ignavibacteria bacterium]|jgi:ribose 5-phosphate isomerase B
MRKLITEEDVAKAIKRGSSVIAADESTIFTPLALDLIRSKKIQIIKNEVHEYSLSYSTVKFPFKKISIGSDHTGFKIKNVLIKVLAEKSYQVYDLGTMDEKSCDFPDFAEAIAENVQLGKSDCGIILDATGIPSAITANKLDGIRAATCYNEFSAKSSRSHNDANILVLGAKSLGEETIKSIVEVWLNTPFEGGRHQRRLDKITGIERKYKS